jgi:hypothetical protein
MILETHNAIAYGDLILMKKHLSKVTGTTASDLDEKILAEGIEISFPARVLYYPKTEGGTTKK